MALTVGHGNIDVDVVGDLGISGDNVVDFVAIDLWPIYGPFIYAVSGADGSLLVKKPLGGGGEFGSFVRAVGAENPGRWHVIAVAACALGMVSKPIMVTAPLMVLLYDRAFIAASFRQALRDRGAVYVALAATWLVLFALLVVPNDSSTSTGFAAGLISPAGYLLTQCRVVVHYLTQAVWPTELCLDHDWPATTDLRQILLPGSLLVVLLGLSLWGYVRRNALGFAGLWVFVVLAPSSSIIPVADYAFDHRMYLPLAGVVTVAV